jgi:hypothetical protein
MSPVYMKERQESLSQIELNMLAEEKVSSYVKTITDAGKDPIERRKAFMLKIDEVSESLMQECSSNRGFLKAIVEHIAKERGKWDAKVDIEKMMREEPFTNYPEALRFIEMSLIGVCEKLKMIGELGTLMREAKEIEAKAKEKEAERLRNHEEVKVISLVAGYFRSALRTAASLII